MIQEPWFALSVYGIYTPGLQDDFLCRHQEVLQ